MLLRADNSHPGIVPSNSGGSWSELFNKLRHCRIRNGWTA